VTRFAIAAGIAAVLAACGSEPPRVELPPVEDAVPDRTLGRVDPAANLDIVSEDITFKAGTDNVPGTLVRPKSGSWPALVLIQGSGPTDRNWNSPLLPNKNGSGKLLAETLAKHGMIVLRYDKVGTGARPPPDYAKLSIDTYVDEVRGALTYLRNRPEVDADHIFLAGHSEGGIHAIRTALVENSRIAGLVLLSAPGRSMATVMMSQLHDQIMTAMPGELGIKQLAALEQAFDDFAEGRPVDPMAVSTIKQLQDLVAEITKPATAALARPLFSFEPTAEIGKLGIPVFVFNGLKDVQVDPQLDAASLEAARRKAGKDVTLFLAPDADHMLKHEPKPMAELKANLSAVQNNYNAPTRKLDDVALSALINWLSAHTQPKPTK
jgi:hypothetical protein